MKYMERRAFLALIAAAPIAALTPLPKLLPRVTRADILYGFRRIRALESLPMVWRDPYTVFTSGSSANGLLPGDTLRDLAEYGRRIAEQTADQCGLNADDRAAIGISQARQASRQNSADGASAPPSPVRSAGRLQGPSMRFP
jgi:hypothetical protein